MEEFLAKENSIEWAIRLAVITFIFYACSVIAIRVYYLYLDKSRYEKSPESIAKKAIYGPEYYFNSVMKILIANTCILGVCCLYDWVLRKFNSSSDYLGIVLLFLISIAVLVNNFIDKEWLGKNWIEEQDKEQQEQTRKQYPKSSLRLFSSMIILLIFIGVSIWFKTSQYMQMILCLLGLVLGRFIYFDSSWTGVKEEMVKMIRCWPSIVLAIVLIVILVSTGIGYDVIEVDNMMTTLFWAHVVYFLVLNVVNKVLNEVMDMLFH